MKKIFTIKADDKNFIITSDTQQFNISKNDLEFKGRDFFDKFLKGLDVSEKVEFIVEKDDSIVENTIEYRLYTELSNLIKQIASKINIELNLLTEDVDAFLNDYDTGDLPF